VAALGLAAGVVLARLLKASARGAGPAAPRGPAAREHRHLLRRFGSRGAAASSRWSDSVPARRATVISGPTGAPMDPLAPARARDH
jgi:hypothetical protein